MTIKQIARSAAVIMQADDLTELLDGGKSEDGEVVTLIKSVNLALSELATVFPIVKGATLIASNGIINISSLPDCAAISSVARGGRTVKFSVTPRGVEVQSDGEHTVFYYAIPDDGGMDEQAKMGAFCDGTIASYLTARNFCLITGRPDEAQIWDARYEDEYRKRTLKRRAHLPSRSWR